MSKQEMNSRSRPLRLDGYPSKKDLEHIPSAYPYGFSDQSIIQLIEGNVTARATHLQPACVSLWGHEYRAFTDPEVEE